MIGSQLACQVCLYDPCAYLSHPEPRDAGMWSVFALCHTCIQFCMFHNKHPTYLGQQVPNHCICQVSLSSPGPQRLWQREVSMWVPPECLCVSLFPSPSLFLCLSSSLFSFSLSLSLWLSPWLSAVCAATGAALWAVWEGRTESTERVRTWESLVFSSGKHPM